MFVWDDRTGVFTRGSGRIGVLVTVLGDAGGRCQSVVLLGRVENTEPQPWISFQRGGPKDE